MKVNKHAAFQPKFSGQLRNLERIKAHLAILFAALLCVRHLTYRCALQYQKLYALPSPIGAHVAKLYKLVGKPYSDIPFCYA